MNMIKRKLSLFGLALATFVLSNAAFASPPERLVIDDTFIDPFFEEACGIQVEVHTEGTLTIRADGSTEKTTGANYKTTFTNLETGKSVILRLSGLQTITTEVSDDLITIIFTFSGGNKLVIGKG